MHRHTPPQRETNVNDIIVQMHNPGKDLLMLLNVQSSSAD